jgi:hypothetical protein
MNVYKINSYHIAAKNADSAFMYYLDKTTSLEDISWGELNEGEEDEFVIKIRKLTSKEMDEKFITCCWDGCEICEGRDEPFLFSPNEMIKKSNKFPCIICREE